jgi:pilus assembly protein CpaE
MAKAHLKVHMGGIATAIEFYHSAQTPNLIVVESREEPRKLLASLTQLAEVCDSSSKVVVIGHYNDVWLYRELVRFGISEYVVAPISMADILSVISSIFVDPAAEPLGRSVAFIGAKGGVGSSTLAHNVGWAMSSLFSSEVVVADLDLAFGTANINFDQDLAQRSAPYLVLDVPHLWSAWSKSVLMQADDVVITATPELANLRNTKNLIDTLRRLRPNDGPPKLVINQAGVPKRPEISPEDFAEPLGLEPMAVIPFDAGLFGNAANNGRMLGETDANHAAVRMIDEIAHVLTGRAEIKAKKKSGISDIIARLKLRK